MVRLSHAKREVDISPNTIRKYNREFGLKIYWVGKSAFFSRSELLVTIRTAATSRPPRRKATSHRRAAWTPANPWSSQRRRFCSKWRGASQAHYQKQARSLSQSFATSIFIAALTKLSTITSAIVGEVELPK